MDILFVSKCCGHGFNIVTTILKTLKDNNVKYNYSSTNSKSSRSRKLLTKEEIENILNEPIIVIDGVKHKAKGFKYE